MRFRLAHKPPASLPVALIPALPATPTSGDVRRVLSACALLASTLLLTVPATAQITRTARDEWQRVEDILLALDLREGSYVADVGAGSGFFSLRLGERVGPGGRVYAVDIDEGVLADLREEAARVSLENMETIVGAVDDPRLPTGSLDAALIVNAYHEMSEYESMLRGIGQALKPGGRLVIVDTPPSRSGRSRQQQMGEHALDLDLAEADLVEAGFRVIRREPSFVPGDGSRRGRRSWLLVAERPEATPGSPPCASGEVLERDGPPQRPSAPGSASSSTSHHVCSLASTRAAG